MTYGHGDEGPLLDITQVIGYTQSSETGGRKRLLRSVIMTCGHRGLQRGRTVNGREEFSDKCKCGTCARLKKIAEMGEEVE